MTHTIAYDSFEDSELLKKAGYNETQIKIEILRTKKQNEEFNKIIDNQLATKHDIALVLKDIMWIKVIGAAFGSAILAALGILLSR